MRWKRLLVMALVAGTLSPGMAMAQSLGDTRLDAQILGNSTALTPDITRSVDPKTGRISFLRREETTRTYQERLETYQQTGNGTAIQYRSEPTYTTQYQPVFQTLTRTVSSHTETYQSPVMDIVGYTPVYGWTTVTHTRTVPGTPAVYGTRTVPGTPAVYGTRMNSNMDGGWYSRTVPGTPAVMGTRTIPGTPAVYGTRTIPGTPAVMGTRTIPGKPGVMGTRRIAHKRESNGASRVYWTYYTYERYVITPAVQPSTQTYVITPATPAHTETYLITPAGPSTTEQYVINPAVPAHTEWYYRPDTSYPVQYVITPAVPAHTEQYVITPAGPVQTESYTTQEWGVVSQTPIYQQRTQATQVQTGTRQVAYNVVVPTFGWVPGQWVTKQSQSSQWVTVGYVNQGSSIAPPSPIAARSQVFLSDFGMTANRVRLSGKALRSDLKANHAIVSTSKKISVPTYKRIELSAAQVLGNGEWQPRSGMTHVLVKHWPAGWSTTATKSLDPDDNIFFKLPKESMNHGWGEGGFETRGRHGH